MWIIGQTVIDRKVAETPVGLDRTGVALWPWCGIRGDSTVDVRARFGAATNDHPKVACDMRERVKKTSDGEEISFPFPQVDHPIIEHPAKPATTEGD